MSYIKDITKEKCRVKRNYETEDKEIFVSVDGGAIVRLYDNNSVVRSRETAEANAQLIAESFNVANETGLSPRELLEQRNKLLKTLEMAMYEVKDWHEYNFNQIDSFDENEKDMQIDVANDVWHKLETIKSVINKSTNNPLINKSPSAEGEKK